MSSDPGQQPSERLYSPCLNCETQGHYLRHCVPRSETGFLVTLDKSAHPFLSMETSTSSVHEEELLKAFLERVLRLTAEKHKQKRDTKSQQCGILLSYVRVLMSK